MKEHPILFSTEMVKAILDRRKTQTRRVITPQPPKGYSYRGNEYNPLLPKFDSHYWMDGYAMWRPATCPYGQPGDMLWVRETFGVIQYDQTVIYKADCDIEGLEAASNYLKWKPSIHMPRWASRINLEVTNIRVERVQDISMEDSIAEGITPDFYNRTALCWWYEFYGDLWDSINKKRGYGWYLNPWVRVIEFKQAHAEETPR